MFRRILYVALLSLVCAPVFGQANVYNQLTRTAAETTDSADVWIPIWDQPATPRKSFKISVAELFKEPKAVVITSGTLADSAPAIDISQTFNDGTEAFTAFKLNVTNTASAATSKLLDLQVGGSSKANVTTSGVLQLPTAATGAPLFMMGSDTNSGIGQAASNLISFYVQGTEKFRVGTGNLTYILSAVSMNSGSGAVSLETDAADTLAQRRTTNAQKLSIYNTYTDGSNYERGVFDWKGTSNTLRIGTEHAGTGVARDTVIVCGGSEVARFLAGTGSAHTGGLYTQVSGGATKGIGVGWNTASTLGVVSGGIIGFVSSSTDGRGAPDTAFARTSAGVMKVTDGSTGFGQLDAKRTTLTGGSVTTASAPLVDATQTWNDGAVTFTGFKQNITDTASGVSSLLFDWQVGGVSYLKLTKFGDLVGSAFTGSDFSVRLQNGSLKQGSASITAWGSSNAAGTMDTALARGGAGIVKFTNASTGAGMIQLQEAGAAPSAPAADNVIIYAIDNGSGKTQLMALFSSGAAQQIAIQP